MNNQVGPYLILTLCILYGQVLAQAQICGKPLLVYTKLAQEHIEPKELNDSLSKEIFKTFFHELDPENIFFTQADIKKLSYYRYKLDDEINLTSCAFLIQSNTLYKLKTNRANHLIDSLLRNPLDFRANEFYQLSDPIKSTPLETEKKLIIKLGLKLKYEVLVTVYNLQQASGKKDFSTADFKKFIPIAQTKIKNSYKKKFEKIQAQLNSKPNYVEHFFLKAIAQVFDPHSEYFNKEEMKLFEESLNAERESFGIYLKENNRGQVRISKLVPGGPAWKSGQLHQGDLLIELKWPGQEAIDLMDYDEEEIDILLHASGTSQGDLTVVKPSGEKKIVSLTKEKILNTENSISSFILQGTHKIGYIDLPGFFEDDGENGLNGCANEVAKEIIKLNKLKIEGLILDLRYNGGGSLQEAIDLAGIFIDAGPVLVMQEKREPPVTYRDMNKGMAFSGPLVILVNGGSASASEVVSAALQDYNRAIVVGSKTFGKATGQMIIPLTQEPTNEDFIKVTVDRLYRLNQNSHQQTGVTPDFILPDFGSLYSITEDRLPYSLKQKTTDKKIYYTPARSPFLDSLKSSSQRRVIQERKFGTIKNIGDLLTQPFPLQEKSFVEVNNTLNNYFEEMSPKEPSTPIYEVTMRDPASSKDEFLRESMLEIKSSIYIKEAFHILLDLIKQKK
jgi:carboxyl-terminal processing protease